MSQTATEIQNSLNEVQTIVTDQAALIANIDARTDAVQEKVGDLVSQIQGLQTISAAEKTQLLATVASIKDGLTAANSKLATESQQLDDTLAAGAPAPAPAP